MCLKVSKRGPLLFLFFSWIDGAVVCCGRRGKGRGVTPPPPVMLLLLLLLQWSFPLGWKPHHYTHSKERFLLFPIFCFLKERNCCWKFIWLRSPLILCVRKRRSRGEARRVLWQFMIWIQRNNSSVCKWVVVLYILIILWNGKGRRRRRRWWLTGHSRHAVSVNSPMPQLLFGFGCAA